MCGILTVLYHILNRLICGVFPSQIIKNRIIHLAEKMGPLTKAMNRINTKLSAPDM